MDKTTLGLIAALGAALPLGAAQAAVEPADMHRTLHATSVAELLNPIPNALEVMKTAQAVRQDAEGTQVAQVEIELGHHHHHHHNVIRRFFYHHHHHHHYYYHHHHHHHHYYYHHNNY